MRYVAGIVVSSIVRKQKHGRWVPGAYSAVGDFSCVAVKDGGFPPVAGEREGREEGAGRVH
jgi:hypothetical protein